MNRVREEKELDFKDVLICPMRSTIDSRSQVSLTTTYKFKVSSHRYDGIPIIASNMDTIGTFEMAAAMSEHGMFTTIHKHYKPEEWVDFSKTNPEALDNVAVSTGIGDQDAEKLDTILSSIPQLNYICIDVANGYGQKFESFVNKTRSKYPDKTIMAGNVVTGDMVHHVIKAGADIVKVGIGPGSVCTTRKKTGCGRPQFSAILECAEVAHRLGAHIISDGGCTDPGDVCKAFAAGADFVMLGGMLAGHDQCPGEIQMDESGKRFKIFYGMASKLAQEKYNAGLASYRASEGKVVKVPYRGDVSQTINDILGGLRSICTYTNSRELKNLTRTSFFRVSRQTNEIFSGLETGN